MKRIIAVLALSVGLSGCITAGEFLGSDDPCGQANNLHSAFLVGLATKPSLQKYARAERAGYTTVMEYCRSGDFSKPTLQRLVGAYAAAVADYKAGQ